MAEALCGSNRPKRIAGSCRGDGTFRIKCAGGPGVLLTIHCAINCTICGNFGIFKMPAAQKTVGVSARKTRTFNRLRAIYLQSAVRWLSGRKRRFAKPL